jgi:multiple sugar transport system permease protein/putative aldouronate transport system permease protein
MVGRKRLSWDDMIYYILAYSIVILLTLLVLYPLVYIVSASFSPGAEVTAGNVWVLPVDPTLFNYQMVLRYSTIYIGYRNTILYTCLGTIINITITCACAYPLSRRDFYGRGFFTFLFTFTMLFSGGMIPHYLLLRDLGMLNTIWAMVIPGAINVSNMIVARTYFQSSIPAEILEASRLDGCSDAQYFFRILVPLSKPVIAVIALFYAVGHWNSYFNAFLYLSNRDLYPLQIVLREILVQNNFSSEMMDPEVAKMFLNLQETLKFAIIVVSTLPLMCFYPFAQKHFVKGVMIGSLKG